MSAISGASGAMTQAMMLKPPSSGTGLAATALAASTAPSTSAAVSAFTASASALSGNLLSLSV